MVTMNYLQTPQPKPLVRFRISAHGVHIFNDGGWIKADRQIFGNVKRTLYDMVRFSHMYKEE